LVLIVLFAALLFTAVSPKNSTLIPCFASNTTSFDPFDACRVGEARKPGPDLAEEAPADFVDETDDESLPLLEDGSEMDEGDWCGRQLNYDECDSHGSSSDDSEPAQAYSQVLHEVVIPPWDAKLPEDQIDAWRAAEDRLGTKRSVKGWLAAKKKKLASGKAVASPQRPPDGTNVVSAAEYTGTMNGFYYGTVDGNLGYHRDSRAAVVRTLSLFDALLGQDAPSSTNVSTKTTRRKENGNGSRVRGKSRRWRALRQEDAATEFLSGPDASLIGTRQPRKLGLWSIDTTNPNAWSTGKRQILSRTSADVVLMQETKQRENKIETAKRQADRMGWRVHLGPALVTSALGTSGGTGVASRKGLGSSPHTFLADGYKHRIGAAWVGAIVKGGVHCFSLYLKDGDGMGDTNTAILTQLAAAIASVKGPWVVGGDWNMTPQDLLNSNWPSIVKGHVHAPALPTCNDSTYDFFVVSNELNGAVKGVVRLSDGGCKPHWAVRLYIHGAARAKAVRRLIKPDAIPGVLPHGPLNKLVHDGDAAGTGGLTEWYRQARQVWHSLLGTQPQVSNHRFRWEAATGKIACPDMGASAVSATLRAMARRLDDSIQLVSKGMPATDSRIRTNVSNNAKACEMKILRSPDVNLAGLRAWCSLSDKALLESDFGKASTLLGTLGKKALKLEEKQSKEVQTKWKQALTQSSAMKVKSRGHGGRLSRLAYRWVKGVAGWSRSTVGPAGDEHCIPEADPGDRPDQIQVTKGVNSGYGTGSAVAPRSDQGEVDAIAKTWAQLWQTDMEYALLDFHGIEDEFLEPLTVDDLISAAATFPVNTGLGVDNFSPRAVTRLPRPLLQDLADILNKGERLGAWDEALELVIIVLLPKGDGSHRPIGLFPGIIRIWMRARSIKAREWEDETAGPEYFGCKGRGAQRAAWMAAFEAELAAAKGLDHAAALIDLVKAFEMIPHRYLVQAARQHGFSLKVLRLSLAAYRIARVIGVDGVFSAQFKRLEA